jgi:hypothetical protein
MHFAALPANRTLDFQQYHNYASLSLGGFNTNVSHLQALHRAFPNQPIMFGEFGWSNHSSSNPTTSQPVSVDLTALYEGAMYAYLRADAFGGAFKWMLNDIDTQDNPREANFGVFKLGDQPKPIRDLLLRFSQDWPSVDQEGCFTPVRDLETGMSYRFDFSQQITVGGHGYQDDTISWQAEGVAHCFIKKENNELLIDALGAGQLSVDPWELLPAWDRAREADLYRVFSEQHRTRQSTFGVGESVVVDVRPGVQYAIAMGAEVPVESPPDDVPQVDPKPGEHVVLLGDSDECLQAALKYIRRFAPDFTFAAEEVAGRWAYVTVVAPVERVSEDVLDNIRGAGAILVERVLGENPEATENLLNDLVGRGQRFLTVVAPPQEEPPSAPPPDEPEPEPEPPPETPGEIYVVQPGDTLGRIAQRLYGDFRLWPLIFEANRDKISNPGLIRVGMELLIPARE